MAFIESRTTIQVSTSLRRELRKLAAERDKNYQELLEEMIGVFRELDKEKTIISLPKTLVERIQKIVQKTDFKTTSEYITFLLRLLLYEQTPNREEDNKKRKNEEEVRKKLQSLGYL